MQPASGIHHIKVGIDPSPPTAGEDVCVTIATPVPSGGLNVLIIVGSTVVHDGPPPENKEICFPTSSEDQGSVVTAFVNTTEGSSPIAYGVARGLLQ